MWPCKLITHETGSKTRAFTQILVQKDSYFRRQFYESDFGQRGWVQPPPRRPPKTGRLLAKLWALDVLIKLWQRTTDQLTARQPNTETQESKPVPTDTCTIQAMRDTRIIDISLWEYKFNYLNSSMHSNTCGMPQSLIVVERSTAKYIGLTPLKDMTTNSTSKRG